MKLTDQQIEEIADYLDSGMRCLYNLRTGEIKYTINFDNYYGGDDELWADDLKELEDNWADYFEFDGMNTHESFRIMEDFADQVPANKLRYDLLDALNRPKPFRNFKWLIDHAGPYREQWFEFKKARLVQSIKDQIGISEEE